MTGQNDALVTVNWPDSPVLRPESQLIGSTYQDIGGWATWSSPTPRHGCSRASSHGQQALPQVVKGEFDRTSQEEPAGGLDVIAIRGANATATTRCHLVDSGRRGGSSPPATPVGTRPLEFPSSRRTSCVAERSGGWAASATMRNVYAVIDRPASLSQPSTGNWNVAYGPERVDSGSVPNNTA